MRAAVVAIVLALSAIGCATTGSTRSGGVGHEPSMSGGGGGRSAGGGGGGGSRESVAREPRSNSGGSGGGGCH